MTYNEFPDNHGLSGRKTGQKPRHKEERLNLVVSAETKNLAKQMSQYAGVSLSTFIDNLINSREASVFAARMKSR